MALRFQVKDEIDKEVEETKRIGLMFFGGTCGVIFVCYSVGIGLFDLFTGKTLKLYGQEIGGILAVLLAAVFADWILTPLHHEFRTRTKEIDGKVSAIEEAVNASKEDHAAVTLSRIEWTVNDTRKDLAGLLERLTAIEEKLSEIQDTRRV